MTKGSRVFDVCVRAVSAGGLRLVFQRFQTLDFERAGLGGGIPGLCDGTKGTEGSGVFTTGISFAFAALLMRARGSERVCAVAAATLEQADLPGRRPGAELWVARRVPSVWTSQAPVISPLAPFTLLAFSLLTFRVLRL